LLERRRGCDKMVDAEEIRLDRILSAKIFEEAMALRPKITEFEKIASSRNIVQTAMEYQVK
jgi:hypothetical protein